MTWSVDAAAEGESVLDVRTKTVWMVKGAGRMARKDTKRRLYIGTKKVPRARCYKHLGTFRAERAGAAQHLRAILDRTRRKANHFHAWATGRHHTVDVEQSMWVAYVKNRVSGANLSVYIDDRTIRSWRARNVRLALQATSEYDAVVGARTHPVETNGWTTGKTAKQKAQLRTFVLLNQIITPTESEKVLGVQHHY